MRLVASPELAWRAGIVLSIDECPLDLPSMPICLGPLPIILVGHKVEYGRHQLARLLRLDPVVTHLEPVLDAVCSAEQRALVIEFIRRSAMRTPRGVARALARSRRSLDRDCERLGLKSPHVLLLVARIARGLTWMSRAQATADQAAILTGYNQTSSFRRAVRNGFGVPVSVLLKEWNDPALLEPRFRRVLRR
jgi:AraC-like DNA-binding protein